MNTTIVKKRKREKKKKKALAVEGLSKGKVWVVGGAYAQKPQGWKRPWGLWWVGLRLKEQKGPRRAPHPWFQRAGDFICRLPLLISPASVLCPQRSTQPGGGFGGQGMA